MKLRHVWKALLPSRAKIPSQSPDTEALRTRRIVASLSRGNLNLRLGRYMTADQLEQRKLGLAKHHF